MKKFRVIALFCLLIIGAFSTGPSFAALRTGGKCSPVNSVTVNAGIKYTCVQSGNKAVWNSGTRCVSPGNIAVIDGKSYLCEKVNERNVLTETKFLWTDEFNGAAGTAPSSSKWTPAYGTGWPLVGWGNNELESYEDYANKMDGDGSLVITASRSKPLNSATAGILDAR
ncbi:MAG: hypothetical protein NTW81_05075 [Actinobacteria bacterium]|nr:hypothetical protein [Actinomycetota bacterium]